ncbi:hypothetical protein [Paracoccus sp. S-4012]|uniref:hypothetical protein n=1 Tax=Paracoccus sp. S-4012 TaxID=2665648 RepID=UPI0012B124F4|nr:hypothetical protein [Paracoccus sp. S-4012]
MPAGIGCIPAARTDTLAEARPPTLHSKVMMRFFDIHDRARLPARFHGERLTILAGL